MQSLSLRDAEGSCQNCGTGGYAPECGSCSRGHDVRLPAKQTDSTRSSRLASDVPYPLSIPNLAQMLSTLAVVLRSISSIAGQGRSNPSAFHLRVASIPIFDP